MRARLQAVMPYELHGTRYYQLIFVPEDGDGEAQQTRLSYDMLYPDPRPGDLVEVSALLGVIERVTKLEEASE